MRNILSYIIWWTRFFLGLPGFAYRLLIWAAVLCSSRFSSCSFGLHTWQIHIPRGRPGEKKNKRGRRKTKEKNKENRLLVKDHKISEMIHGGKNAPVTHELISSSMKKIISSTTISTFLLLIRNGWSEAIQAKLLAVEEKLHKNSWGTKATSLRRIPILFRQKVQCKQTHLLALLLKSKYTLQNNPRESRTLMLST